MRMVLYLVVLGLFRQQCKHDQRALRVADVGDGLRVRFAKHEINRRRQIDECVLVERKLPEFFV